MRLKKPSEINQDNLFKNNTDFHPHSPPLPSIYPLEQQKNTTIITCILSTNAAHRDKTHTKRSLQVI